MMTSRAPRVNFFYNVSDTPPDDEVVAAADHFGDSTVARQAAIEAVAAYRLLRDREKGQCRDKRELERAAKRAAKQKRDADIHAMLEDGASYTEVAETFGSDRSTIRDKFPGYGWTSSEGGQVGMMVRWSGMERPVRAH